MHDGRTWNLKMAGVSVSARCVTHDWTSLCVRCVRS
jgi:hypothetical protein